MDWPNRVLRSTVNETGGRSTCMSSRGAARGGQVSLASVGLVLLAGSYPFCTKRIVSLGPVSPSWGAGAWPITYVAGILVIALVAAEFMGGALRARRRLLLLISIPALGIGASVLGVAAGSGDFVQFGRSYVLCLYFIALFASIGMLVNGAGRLRLFCRVLTFGAVIAALVSSVQAAGVTHIPGLPDTFLVFNKYGPEHEVRMASFFDEPTNFGLFSAFMANLLLASEAVGDSWPLRPWANRAAVLVLVSGVVLSRSMLGLGILFFGVWWVAVATMRRRKVVRLLSVIVGLLFAGMLVAAFVTAQFESWFEGRLARASSIASLEDPSARMRWTSVKAGLDELGRRPLFGCGLGNFRHSAEAREDLQYIDSAVVQLLAETGVVGLVSLTVFFSVIFGMLHRLGPQKGVRGSRGAPESAKALLCSGSLAAVVSSAGGFSGFLFWLPPFVAIAVISAFRGTKRPAPRQPVVDSWISEGLRGVEGSDGGIGSCAAGVGGCAGRT